MFPKLSQCFCLFHGRQDRLCCYLSIMALPLQQEDNVAPNDMNPRRTALYANSLSIQSCDADDPAMMERAISLVSHARSRITPEKLAIDGLKRAATRNALRVLRYLLDHGQVDVNILRADNLATLDICKPPSLTLLETLAEYNWDSE